MWFNATHSPLKVTTDEDERTNAHTYGSLSHSQLVHSGLFSSYINTLSMKNPHYPTTMDRKTPNTAPEEGDKSTRA